MAWDSQNPSDLSPKPTPPLLNVKLKFYGVFSKCKTCALDILHFDKIFNVDNAEVVCHSYYTCFLYIRLNVCQLRSFMACDNIINVSFTVYCLNFGR